MPMGLRPASSRAGRTVALKTVVANLDARQKPKTARKRNPAFFTGPRCLLPGRIRRRQPPHQRISPRPYRTRLPKGGIGPTPSPHLATCTSTRLKERTLKPRSGGEARYRLHLQHFRRGQGAVRVLHAAELVFPGKRFPRTTGPLWAARRFSAMPLRSPDLGLDTWFQRVAFRKPMPRTHSSLVPSPAAPHELDPAQNTSR